MLFPSKALENKRTETKTNCVTSSFQMKIYVDSKEGRYTNSDIPVCWRLTQICCSVAITIYSLSDFCFTKKKQTNVLRQHSYSHHCMNDLTQKGMQTPCSSITLPGVWVRSLICIYYYFCYTSWFSEVDDIGLLKSVVLVTTPVLHLLCFCLSDRKYHHLLNMAFPWAVM